MNIKHRRDPLLSVLYAKGIVHFVRVIHMLPSFPIDHGTNWIGLAFLLKYIIPLLIRNDFFFFDCMKLICYTIKYWLKMLSNNFCRISIASEILSQFYFLLHFVQSIFCKLISAKRRICSINYKWNSEQFNCLLFKIKKKKRNMMKFNRTYSR